MTLVVCIDRNGTVLFNNRRVSSDKVVIEDILSMLGRDEELIILPYSVQLFPADKTRVVPTLTEAKVEEGIFFAECVGLAQLQDWVDKVVIYDWNRVYPKGDSFDFNLDDFHLVGEVDLVGKSHEKISRRVYLL